jgi:hypothetical protein
VATDGEMVNNRMVIDDGVTSGKDTNPFKIVDGLKQKFTFSLAVITLVYGFIITDEKNNSH